MTSSGGREDVLRGGHTELEGTRRNQRRAVNWQQASGARTRLTWVVRNVSVFFFFHPKDGERKGGRTVIDQSPGGKPDCLPARLSDTVPISLCTGLKKC